MKYKRFAIDTARNVLGILFPLLVLAGTSVPLKGHPAPDDEAAASPTALSDIIISFKLDPRLTKGLYMGDRWVSPLTYTGVGGQDTIEARAVGLDANGKKTVISPKWIPSDPEMVMVSPGQGTEVKIAVKRAGESRLHVKAGGFSKRLAIQASYNNDTIQLEITQLETETSARVNGASVFKGEKERLSYALGMSLVNQLRSQGVDMDADSYLQGFRDALSGSKTLLTEPEARAAVTELQIGMRGRQTALSAEKRKELAEKNQKEGEAFLAANKTKEGVITLASGLQYKILKTGDGQKPKTDDTVVCHYRGTLIDGTEFDTSYRRDEPATFPLTRVIKGWTEALQLMTAGSKWEIFIPPNLAYGDGSAGSKIGPNATLIFDVELLSIKGQDEKSQDQSANRGAAAGASQDK